MPKITRETVGITLLLLFAVAETVAFLNSVAVGILVLLGAAYLVYVYKVIFDLVIPEYKAETEKLRKRY